MTNIIFKINGTIQASYVGYDQVSYINVIHVRHDETENNLKGFAIMSRFGDVVFN